MCNHNISRMIPAIRPGKFCALLSPFRLDSRSRRKQQHADRSEQHSTPNTKNGTARSATTPEHSTTQQPHNTTPHHTTPPHYWEYIVPQTTAHASSPLPELVFPSVIVVVVVVVVRRRSAATTGTTTPSTPTNRNCHSLNSSLTHSPTHSHSRSLTPLSTNAVTLLFMGTVSRMHYIQIGLTSLRDIAVVVVR